MKYKMRNAFQNFFRFNRRLIHETKPSGYILFETNNGIMAVQIVFKKYYSEVKICCKDETLKFIIFPPLKLEISRAELDPIVLMAGR